MDLQCGDSGAVGGGKVQVRPGHESPHRGVHGAHEVEHSRSSFFPDPENIAQTSDQNNRNYPKDRSTNIRCEIGKKTSDQAGCISSPCVSKPIRKSISSSSMERDIKMTYVCPCPSGLHVLRGYLPQHTKFFSVSGGNCLEF